ncbi:hypothetical protein [Autumnicola psychrophila]|uniref:DUF4382 domain-containing protein n=1 Tax=Autumnicola psychrophila TaxID=3075592 RepID=A0ABU3DME3_9FLAO|nr:hypothetical protein [Zunongwangia sp. F225]MDT0684872.1 hypothetical protein [Zunongwangia sp. F225]
MKKIKILFFSFFIVFLVFSCDTDIDDADVNFIMLDLNSNEDLTFTNPAFTLNLYGVNDTITNATEVLLASQNYEVEELPSQIRMEIPEDPYAPIPDLADNNNARFYLEIEWDSDNNGQLCQGDIDLNYSIQNVELININRRDPQEVMLTTVPETVPCE